MAFLTTIIVIYRHFEDFCCSENGPIAPTSSPCIRQNKKQTGEQIKTTECCFYRCECAGTRSNESKACPCEQNDYVPRDVEHAELAEFLAGGRPYPL